MLKDKPTDSPWHQARVRCRHERTPRHVYQDLIANRGEIACRVIKTARKMGIATVAVYSGADKDALFVELADEPCASARPPRRSYLVADHKIIAAMQRAGAQAVHPNTASVKTPSSPPSGRGVRLLGPKHYSIAVGDKIESARHRSRCEHHPGYNDAIAGGLGPSRSPGDRLAR